MLSKWLRRAAVRRTLFAAVALCLMATVGWLGWRVLAQERQAAQSAADGDRQAAADSIVAAFGQRLSEIERTLDDALGSGELARGAVAKQAVVVRMTGDAIRAWPEDGLLYYPPLPARPATPEADAMRRLATASLKTRDFTTALRAYDRIEALGSQPIGDVVGGIPAALFAHLGRMTAYELQGDNAARTASARALDAALRSGRWPVSDGTFLFLRGQVAHVLPTTSDLDDQLTIAEAVTWLVEQRTRDPRFATSGRASRLFDSGPALLVWRSSADAVVAWVAGRRLLADEWMPQITPLLQARRARVAVTTPEGQPIVGTTRAQDRQAVRSASAALPLAIQVTNTVDDDRLQARRRLLLAGMAMLFVFIVAGAWVIERTVARELAIADLQSDFVSAVSHEFRTPLTTLCQLSEMLMRNRVASDDDRHQYYALLHGESQRLRRLVETLLHFGRLEAGRMEFHFGEIDVAALVRDTVGEFAVSRQALRHRVELSGNEVAMPIHADGELLKSALWNLLENAAKYSPDCDAIWVTLRRQGSGVTISVRDRGVGIPASEQQQIFEKFVRGAGARSSGVGGTGVGLAMTRRIVDAHGGAVTVESAVGVGSTFTVMLPLIVSAPSNPPRPRPGAGEPAHPTAETSSREVAVR